jgi:pantoate--beta-alanine ligase
MPEVVTEPRKLRECLREKRRSGASIGFVPTMGALHSGHAALLEAARSHNDFVAASIFVNPLQFNRTEDLDTYPRSMEADLCVCDRYGVDLVFAPTQQDLYPSEPLTFVESPVLSVHLCGQFRPGHFRGVATVVLKLFHLIEPDRAYFGEKDAQQLAIIRRMVEDFNLPLTIVPIPTVREPDGLAISSRNQLLTPEQRAIAPVLSRSLRQALELVRAGERRVTVVREQAVALLMSYPEARLEYFEVVDRELLAPLDEIIGPVLIAAAMWLGPVRLIDNVSWSGSS